MAHSVVEMYRCFKEIQVNIHQHLHFMAASDSQIKPFCSCCSKLCVNTQQTTENVCSVQKALIICTAAARLSDYLKNGIQT
jgi:hypothetical protein